jgi:hypothetical protein
VKPERPSRRPVDRCRSAAVEVLHKLDRLGGQAMGVMQERFRVAASPVGESVAMCPTAGDGNRPPSLDAAMAWQSVATQVVFERSMMNLGGRAC